jgi:hypothetical protein
VTALELSFADLNPVVARQLNLFEREPVPQEHLREVLHDLAARHPCAPFFWVRVLDEHARLPERRWRLERVEQV